MKFLFLALILCLLRSIAEAVSPHKAMVLRNRYGYLDLPNITHLNSPFFEHSLFVDGSYKMAITKLQKQYRLPITRRIISEEVGKLLTARRCKIPDFFIKFNNNSIKINKTQSTYAMRRVKRYVIVDPRFRWMKTDLTWRIISYPTSGLSQSAVDAIFTKAFNMWSEVANLNFKRVSGNADIIIEFRSREHGDSIPFDGPNNFLAHAFNPSGITRPLYSRSGDAHFDDDENWVDGDKPEGRNLLAVAIHELGHSMGLGHSTSENALMYQYYIDMTRSQLQLDEDDIKGIQEIYGPAKRGKILSSIPYVPRNGYKDTHPSVTTIGSNIQGKLDMCNTTIDAVIIIRQVEICVFSGKSQWRIDFSRTKTSRITYVFRDGPESILYYWPILPKYVDHIDGGIERKDQRIYIFRDDTFWLLEDNKKVTVGMSQYGLPLTELGLPYHLKKIDTIFRWGYNNALYIMAGYQYWKIDETKGTFGHTYPQYPRSIRSVWKDVPLPIDVAFTDPHQQTYFIREKFLYVFNNLEMRVTENAEPLMAPWIGCKKR